MPSPTVTQALHLISGDTVQQKMTSDRGVLAKMIEEKKSDRAIMEHFTLAALSRMPTAQELDAGGRERAYRRLAPCGAGRLCVGAAELERVPVQPLEAAKEQEHHASQNPIAERFRRKSGDGATSCASARWPRFGLTTRDLFAATEGATPKDDRSVILLWLSGGPGQMDTFDMKPERTRIFAARSSRSRRTSPA